MNFKQYFTEAKVNLPAEAKKVQSIHKKLSDIDELFMDTVIKYKFIDEKKSKLHKQSIDITNAFLELSGKIKDFKNNLATLGKKELK